MRLFVAIELNRDMKRSLQKTIDGLSAFGRAVRWVTEEQMHVTLKFLGEVDRGDVAAVCEACERVASNCQPFEFALESSGCFPAKGRVRVIWGGSSQTCPELLACASGCEDAFEKLDFARETRPFSTHMTIGRVRQDDTQGRLRMAVDEMVITPARQKVDSMTLFESVLSPRGARYSVVGQYPLGGLHGGQS